MVPGGLGPSEVRRLKQMEDDNRELFDLSMEDAAYWRARDVEIIAGALVVSCEMTLSLARTFPQFTLDLHRMPDRVQAALEAMVLLVSLQSRPSELFPGLFGDSAIKN